ncbi:Subtilisin inhibitor-like [Amycolatopsis arida]|uniref:Subtilisin inhibitor-like n=1 Tax=Amycolatopsis arida TaxID=587909 RepID=A0A1I5SSP9_9PSEU|nr:subtilase-type protease inhibitor [Amycolatopsis arida]TDX96363.1 subtilisin inhibitor-like [Amycolatopsis arida]SFP73802.1 Subtilisin inhibitor-like [Amycolatopsis arida]
MLHKRFLRSVLAAALLLPAVAATGAAPAAAEPAEPQPRGVLVMTASHGEKPSPHANRVLLTCDPTGGTHPYAETACTRLAAVDGDIAAVSVGPDRPCYLIYAPITVTAKGFWDGQPVRYRETFPNDCVLEVEKGALFRFAPGGER